jgi:F-type H+-transporting ATPase subunit b
MLPSVLSAAAETANPLIPSAPDLIWSTVIFIVLFIFFWKKILPSVQKTLDARAELIEGGIKKAENAQAEAAAALEKYNEQLAEARAEAAKIRDQARQDGTKILTELKEQASTEAARITASASAQIEAERPSALVSLRAEVGAQRDARDRSRVRSHRPEPERRQERRSSGRPVPGRPGSVREDERSRQEDGLKQWDQRPGKLLPPHGQN